MRRLWELMETPVTDVASLRRRTNLLVVIHIVLTAAATAVLVVLVQHARLFVTLAQRSNVETLILAFVLCFVLFLLASTFPGLRGSLVLLGVRALHADRGQAWIQRRLERGYKETKRAYLNVIVEGPDGGTIDLPIEDAHGRIGTLRLDGGEVALVGVPRTLVHSPLLLATHLLGEVGTLDGTDSPPRIVAWGGTDEEVAERYGSEVRAFKRLAQALHAPLWPTVRIDAAGIARLREVMRAAAPDLREDVLLPDIEYRAEFTVPIIPEPLAFVQVRREQEHADPVASLGAAALVVLALLGLMVWIVVVPPWVPGK
jgi:hypothetical protein